MAKKDTDKKSTKQDGKAKGGSAPVAGLPLFYKSPMPLDAKRHAKMGLKKDIGLRFTQGVNAVPVNLIEMPQICHYYPIAFSPDGNATPVAILGLRDNENLYLREDGRWEEAYIPAYIRRYPFIFSEMPGGEQLTLCIDNNSDTVSENSEQPFFDKDGKPSAMAKAALEFCKSYHAAAQQTAEFSKALAASNLLVDREAQIKTAAGKPIRFSGFKIVDEQKLAALDDKTFLQWRQKGWLPFLYAHLFSGAQWQRLTGLLNEKLQAEAA